MQPVQLRPETKFDNWSGDALAEVIIEHEDRQAMTPGEISDLNERYPADHG